MTHPRADDAFARGIQQFNSRRFFEAHESWEEIWLAAPEPEKTFLQGIIQTAAAFHHYTRDNPAGALSLLREGLKKLQPFPEEYRGIRLEPLRAAARAWLAVLEGAHLPPADAFPRIEHL